MRWRQQNNAGGGVKKLPDISSSTKVTIDNDYFSVSLYFVCKFVLIVDFSGLFAVLERTSTTHD